MQVSASESGESDAERLLRCPKHVLHGPCGGVVGDGCEVPGYPCPWGRAFIKAETRPGKTEELVSRLSKLPAEYKLESSPAEMVSASHLGKLLRGNQFAGTAELGPPKGADADVIRKKGKSCVVLVMPSTLRTTR